jgi:Multicopper oxidase
MKFFERCWVLVLQVFDAIISPWSGDSALQQPLLGGPIDLPTNGRGPSFGAPNSPLEDQFICNYSAMGSHWKSCSTEFDRGCWLKDTLHGQDFDINTDYENRWPNGTLRTYTLDVSELPLNLDGVTMPYGKTFNRTYPGPWIQACWGDDVQITVTNNIRKFNGTTIHWHGVRQLNTFQHDGVNGVTQCPIPPGSSYTYSFKVTQYGSTWYHSHYSLQYADGLVGPMTFYGPSSANYDLAIEPTLMTDWNHESAFTDLSRMQFTNSGPPDMDSILLNGIGVSAYHCQSLLFLTSSR